MMRNRRPEQLRNDPHVAQESVRLLLYGLARASSDALIGDRDHPIFVPALNIAQNIFQPNADTIYKTAMISKGGSYRLRGDRGTVDRKRVAEGKRVSVCVALGGSRIVNEKRTSIRKDI